jgi:aromatic ring-cleaving dioxygenase
MTDAPMPAEIGTIDGWHAHVYYDPATRAQAAMLRDWVEQRYPVRMGRWHDVPVGPHPGAMYQIAFNNAVFPDIAAFLSLNRQGLTILLHPNTAHPRADHLHHAYWLGAVLQLDASVLPEVA